MTSHGMLVCSFYIKKRFSQGTNELLPLNLPFSVEIEEGKRAVFDDVFHMLSNFCLRNTFLSDDEKLQKVFSIKENSYQKFDEATHRSCTFIVKSGSYGVEGEITNRRTQEITHRMNSDEAPVKEFRVVAYVHKDAGDVIVTKGILVFQSIASFGVKTITLDRFRRFFAEYDLTIETRSVSVRTFIEKLIEQGNLYKITLIRNQLSPNTTDNMLINTGREEVSYIHPKLKQEWLQKILTIFQRADETGICEIPDEENFDDLSVHFKLGDHTRTVRLKYLDRQSIIEDIPDEIIRDRDENSLSNYMIQTANAYEARMVFRIGG